MAMSLPVLPDLKKKKELSLVDLKMLVVGNQIRSLSNLGVMSRIDRCTVSSKNMCKIEKRTNIAHCLLLLLFVQV